MSKKIPKRGGGWNAVKYSFVMSMKAGGPHRLLGALRRRNTCKACALGMKGMRNELGQGFQVCKKAMQAIVQDLRPAIKREFWEKNSIKDLKTMSPRKLESLGRLGHPLLREQGDTHFRPISWDDAFSMIHKKMLGVAPERTIYYASGRSSNEAAFLLQLMARQQGSNHVNNCSYYCHQASGVGLGRTFGSGTATVTLEDVTRSDLLVLIGANPSSNHPRFMTQLMALRERGGRVVVINPLKEIGLQRFAIPSEVKSLFFTNEIASHYLQPHCGGDMAFLKAAVVKLWQEDRVDKKRMKKYCDNFDSWRSDIDSSNYEELLGFSGLSQAELNTFCDLLVNSENIIFSWAMGITHQKHGVESVQMISALALMLGMVGKEGAGLLPLRGHSNVQGVGTVGVIPKLKPKMVQRIGDRLGLDIPDHEGFDTYACMKAMDEERVDVAFYLGGNLLSSNPDTEWARKSLSKVPFTIQLSTTLNFGHLEGQGRTSLILPVRTRDEESHFTTQESMFNFVRYSEGGAKPPIKDLPSEIEIITRIAGQLFGNDTIEWDSLVDTDKIRDMISQVVPGLERISDVVEEEFTIPGRIYHEKRFSTKTGKAQLEVLSPPDARPSEGKFNLTTFRSEGQFNSIIYEERDLYRGTTHRDVVLMNPEDITNLGIKEGEYVKIRSAAGELKVQVVSYDIRMGNVGMYYPEGNVIVPRELDPQSKTPVFKRIEVTISPIHH